jgi:hypothetical protein
MKRSVLLFATVGTLLLTAFVLYRVGCPRARANHNANREIRDPLASSAGVAFRQSQPRHWRDVIMQP